MCTVFAESEVISHLSNNVSLENVASGAVLSIAKRVSGMAKRLGVMPSVMMTGGGSLNHSLVAAISEQLELAIDVPSNPQVIGALGAAVFAHALYHKPS